ncbi:MAG: DUF1203 domain-containing protein [Stagnimonas sp.]|nr:DUF1203 domain-containing protein [Stagnimonas sp.]
MNIHIAPLPEHFLHRVRVDGRDDLDQPVERFLAEGGEPCRDVLRRARAGEPLVLASHSPFRQPGPFREFGPVYVLAEASGDAVERRRLPLPHGGATDYFGERLVLRAYSAEERIVDARLVTAAEAEAVAAELLRRSDAAFLQARFPIYGCFACRIDRLATPG